MANRLLRAFAISLGVISALFLLGALATGLAMRAQGAGTLAGAGAAVAALACAVAANQRTGPNVFVGAVNTPDAQERGLAIRCPAHRVRWMGIVYAWLLVAGLLWVIDGVLGWPDGEPLALLGTVFAALGGLALLGFRRLPRVGPYSVLLTPHGFRMFGLLADWSVPWSAVREIRAASYGLPPVALRSVFVVVDSAQRLFSEGRVEKRLAKFFAERGHPDYYVAVWWLDVPQQALLKLFEDACAGRISQQLSSLDTDTNARRLAADYGLLH